MKNIIENKFIEPLLLKGRQRDLPTNCELLWDVKMKNGNFGKKQKRLKTETTTPFSMEL